MSAGRGLSGTDKITRQGMKPKTCKILQFSFKCQDQVGGRPCLGSIIDLIIPLQKRGERANVAQNTGPSVAEYLISQH